MACRSEEMCLLEATDNSSYRSTIYRPQQVHVSTITKRNGKIAGKSSVVRPPIKKKD